MAPSRLLADRRRGVDQRAIPRRAALVRASQERRRVVDRRRGAERRSTLDRRARSARHPSVESPGEHLRNALQLLSASGASGEPRVDQEDFAAALERLRRALQLLERRPGP
jgi:hypothetical protein